VFIRGYVWNIGLRNLCILVWSAHHGFLYYVGFLWHYATDCSATWRTVMFQSFVKPLLILIDLFNTGATKPFSFKEICTNNCLVGLLAQAQ